MNMQEFADQINQLLKEKPELKTATAVYSIDDEGNGFDEVQFGPTLGHYKGFEFHAYEKEGENPGPINAVCIN